ncbi:MAG: hypothetical protein HYX92_13825 [Chloroflexi bacterium]|nr:hypothetical protein [Chloroflexota bacterium]
MPFSRRIILDNDVVSRLYVADALEKVALLFPPGCLCITEQVLEEARRWPAKGARLANLLEDLERKGHLSRVSVDDSSEEVWAYAELTMKGQLGQGESASIAIACSRGFDIATDDALARQACMSLNPDVTVFGTGALLNRLVADGSLTRAEADAFQARIRRARGH